MTPVADKHSVLVRLEPVLSYARHADSVEALRACRAFLALFTAPKFVVYDPARTLRAAKEYFAPPRCDLRIEDLSECVGEPDALLSCIRALADSARLEVDAGLAIEAFEAADRGEMIPGLAWGSTGPDISPPKSSSNDFSGFPCRSCPNAGSASLAAGGLTRRRTGLNSAQGASFASRTVEGLADISQCLEEKRELYERNESSSETGPSPISGIAAEVLALLDGEARAEPIALRRVAEEVFRNREHVLANSSIAAEILDSGPIPPTACVRPRLRTFFEVLLDYSVWILPDGGRLSLMMEYVPSRRAVDLFAEIHGEELHGPGNLPRIFHAPRHK